MYNHDGSVKNCIRSSGKIGNLHKDPIEKILEGESNLLTQQKMLEGSPGPMCHPCYDLEHGKKNFDIVSDRIFYIRELKKTPLETYRLGNHELKVIDVRWSNLCNFACIYCGPEYSSKWASELQIQSVSPSLAQTSEFKKYIFDRIESLKHVYLAGGEPLLMKENLELLIELKKRNPLVSLRINTNLSKVDTGIFDMICQFEKVHWTISIETLGPEFEYIRYGSKWQDFCDNLSIIKKLDHKISFNMLYFLLNARSLFDCIDYLKSLGFHNNSFVIGALLGPVYLDIRNLPPQELKKVQKMLEHRINQNPGYLLEDSYRNLLHYTQQSFLGNLGNSLEKLRKIDARRGLNSQKLFAWLYELDKSGN